jgi:hypothetical protein
MARHYRSARRNTGKRLKSKIRGGSQPQPVSAMDRFKSAAGTVASTVVGATGNLMNRAVAAAPDSLKENVAAAAGVVRSGAADATAAGARGLLTVSQKLRPLVPAPTPTPTPAPAPAPATLTTNDIIELLRVITFKYPNFLEGMRLFNSADSNGDGSLDGTEFRKIMESLYPGITEEESTAQFTLANTNNDDSLSLLEFLEYYTQITKPV